MSFATYVSPNVNQGNFAEEEEVTNRFHKVYYDGETENTFGGLNVISDGNSAYVDDSDVSTMVVGAPGSMKSRLVVMPYVISVAHAGSSMIIHDCKGEINRYLYRKLKKLGYTIVVLDYRDSWRGARYNPLEYPARLYKRGEKSRALSMIKHFAMSVFSVVKSDKDPFWYNTAMQYFCGLAELACQILEPEDVTINNIYNIHLQGEKKFARTNYMKVYFEGNEDAGCWKRLYPTVEAPSETKKSILSVFSSALDEYIQSESILDQTSHSTFSIEDIEQEKTAVFLISKDEGSVCDNLIASVVDQFYEILTERAEEQGGTLSRRVEFILDEFGNMAKLHDMAKKVAMSRSRNIRWLLVCQSLQQLNLVYEDNSARIILGSCSNLVYLYSPDVELLEYISKLCGRTTDEYTGVKRELMSLEQLRHLSKEEGEVLMVLGRMNPLMTYLVDISQYSGIKPTKYVNVETRPLRELPVVNFTKIVEDKKEEKSRQEYVVNKQKVVMTKMLVKEQQQDVLNSDPANMLDIINGVIQEVLEEK